MPEIYEEGAWKRAIRLSSGKLVPVELRSVGSVDDPRIEVNHFVTLTEQEKEELSEKLDEIFSFSQNLNGLYEFIEQNVVLRNVKKMFYGLKAGSIGTTVFEHIVKSIIQQQISIRVAFSITNKMVTKFGDQTKVNDNVYFDFPTPQSFVDASLEDLRQCGVSWKKAEYIKTLAEKIVNSKFDPEALRQLSNEQILETLTAFRGIGTWTAEMVLAAGLKRNATVPAGDLGVRRTVSRFYSEDKLLSEKEVRKITENWKEYTKDIVYYISCIERT
jgi:DNA-3-methyladenine glycosylase II